MCKEPAWNVECRVLCQIAEGGNRSQACWLAGPVPVSDAWPIREREDGLVSNITRHN